MIAVVGATLSGLTAAARLGRRGYDVQVFEASDEIGGLATPTETNGEPIETVPVSLSRPRDERALAVLAEFGLDDHVEWHATRSGTYVDGTVHPMDTPWEFLAAPHLSLSDTARLAALTSGIDVSGVPRQLPNRGAYDDPETFADVPAEAFLRTHASARVYDRFFEPILSARFGPHASDVSATWILEYLRGERETTRFGREIRGSIAGSAARLRDTLVDAIGADRIHTNAAVTAIDVETGDGSGPIDAGTADSGERVDSITVDRSGTLGEETHAVDAVVIAAGSARLEALTGYHCSLPVQTRTCVRIATTTALTDVARVTIADEAPFDELVAGTAFVPVERYGGHHQYYLLDGGTAADRGKSAATVERRWLEALGTLFPRFDRNDLQAVETTRFRQPVYDAGYQSALVPIDLTADVADGVYYAGIASAPQYPERHLGGAIDAGLTCADRLADGDRTRRPRNAIRH